MTLGQHPAPAASAQVAIAREVLDIVVGSRHADVRVEIDLENRGGPVSMPVGFPCARGVDEGVSTLACRVRPRVEIDGSPVPLWRVRSEQGGEWMWRMRLARGQQVKLVVRYRTPLLNENYDVPFDGCSVVLYRLKTGAAWAGPIGELEMRVRLPAGSMPVADILPDGYARRPGEITWHLRDHEPTEDLLVAFLLDARVMVRRWQLRDARGAHRPPAEAALRAAIDRFAAQPLDALVDRYMEMAATLEELDDIPRPPRDRVTRTLAVSMADLRRESFTPAVVSTSPASPMLTRVSDASTFARAEPRCPATHLPSPRGFSSSCAWRRWTRRSWHSSRPSGMRSRTSPAWR